ncbi:MAG: hypothetical protein M3R10_07835 [Verrucomicrobiota bacterium]|nr:hypothetical protein [Verrucomicrobiota bacterium]
MKSILRSKLFWFLIVLAVLLIIVRILLPFWVRDYVNKTLDHLDDYHGHVEDVDLALWRGAYKIRQIKIVKTSGDVPVPFFSAPVIDLSVQWLALFHGSLVGEINFVRPELNFVNAPDKADSQVGLEEPWTNRGDQPNE